jgi:hypothetical protein
MQAATSSDWTPLMNSADIKPASRGSSEKLSKFLPPRGDRCIQTVGPIKSAAPLVKASWPIARPTRYASGVLKVDARDTEAGKQAAGTPSKTIEPRAPLGPSVTYECKL